MKDHTTRMRISTAPVNWNNNDLPSWRPVVPFPAVLDEMRLAGYHVTEYDDAFGDDPGVVTRELNSRDMSLAGAYTWLDLSTPGAIENDLPMLDRRLDLLDALDCRHLIVADALRPERVAIAGAVPPDGGESLDQDGFLLLLAALSTVVSLAQSRRIAVHYHNHAGTYVETPPELEILASSLAETGADLCFDTGHYAFGGGNARDFLAEHLGQVGYLHLKDVDGNVLDRVRAARMGFLAALREYVFCPLGDGAADIPGIIASLVTAGFPGFIVVEQDTCRGDRTATARDNRMSFERFLNRHS